MWRQCRFEEGGDGFGFGHAAGAVQAAGQLAFAHGYDAYAVGLQGAQVALRGRVLPHVEVHSRRHPHGAARRQIDGREHVVAQALCHARQRVGRGGGHQQGIGPQAQLDVAVPRPFVVYVGVHLVARQGGQRERADEVGGGAGHHYAYLGACLDEQPHQHGTLVGGNAACDAEEYFFSLKRHGRSGLMERWRDGVME